MSWIIENWCILVATIAVVALAGTAIYNFVKSPSSTQISALKEWLKYAVTLAEKELGSGTGQLKLRYVYEMFVSKFTWLAQIIDFDTFSDYVDEALEWMRKQLEENTAVSELVTGTLADSKNSG